MYENKEEIEKVILFAVDLDNGEQVQPIWMNWKNW